MHTNTLKTLLLIIALLLTQIAISRWAWWIIIHVSSGSDRQHLVSESRGPSNDHYQVSWNTNTRRKCENTTNNENNNWHLFCNSLWGELAREIHMTNSSTENKWKDAHWVHRWKLKFHESSHLKHPTAAPDRGKNCFQGLCLAWFMPISNVKSLPALLSSCL